MNSFLTEKATHLHEGCRWSIYLIRII
uniref:Uncharacterized protein n=1 Tax=Arundo donax TaxID=35708 RepID=A0A0A9D313_ARUDO